MADGGPPDHPPGRGLPPPARSFVAMLFAGSSMGSSEPGIVSTFRGEPALRMSHGEMLLLAEPFPNVLVGRFAYGRPSMKQIRRFIVSLGLKGDCPVGLLDSKHVLLRLMVEEDYTSHLVCSEFSYGNLQMDVRFQGNQEISIVPVWASFPNLPLPFFCKSQR